MSEYYVLDGRNVRQASDPIEWAVCFQTQDWRVAHTVAEHYEVSTVFLGANQRAFTNGPPILFETMVITSDRYKQLVPEAESLDEVILRYSSWDDAEVGHATQVRRIAKQVEMALRESFADAEPGSPSR